MAQTRVSKEELEKIKSLIETVRFGSVSIIVQDGKLMQVEKHEKIRFNS